MKRARNRWVDARSARHRRRRQAASDGRPARAPGDGIRPPGRLLPPAPIRRRRWLLIAGGSAGAALVLVAAVWTIGLVRFARQIPHDIPDGATGTDAIVVLTGGSQRVLTGVQLLADNKAERALISGVHPGVGVGELLRVAGTAVPSGVEGRIDAGYGARDTAGNAAEAAGWMQARQYRSLRLVTGSYHMPRSTLEFECALPGIQVVPHPVFPDRVQQGAWWRHPGTAALIISEYHKYLLASLHHRLLTRGRACR